ncbi:MAG: D-alanyl-D-alanine carboxypeptidase [Cyanobacteria bacterium P01_F01_bin.42]
MFLESLENNGVASNVQGLWIQSGTHAYAAHRESAPLAAASVTKIATSLTALQQLGPAYRFTTKFGYTGRVVDGTLRGDLVVAGGDDPFFVWEHAFEVANLVESLGIKQVSGSLIIQAPFAMNFESEGQLAGELLRQALSSSLWSEAAIAQFSTLPSETPRPNIQVLGDIQIVSKLPGNTTWLVQHQSLPLIELLKRMNRYSNNPMADQIASYLGGADHVTQVVQTLTGLGSEEVKFINGSGLGTENQITPQGAALMIQALAKFLESEGMSLGDVMTIVGVDEGILDPRPLPTGLVAKSGTLDQVSALAGVLPTQTEGPIWFSMFNTQGDVVSFRRAQEALLGEMVNRWGMVEAEATLAPTLNPAQLQTITRPL